MEDIQNTNEVIEKTVENFDDVVVEDTTDIEIVEEKSNGAFETVMAVAGIAATGALIWKVGKFAKNGFSKAKTFVKGGVAAVREKADQEDAKEDVDDDVVVEVIDAEVVTED